MSTETIHKEAMDLAEEAELARRRGDVVKYKSLLQHALDLEKGAANAYLLESEFEPTRSVLFRSAASLAVELEDWRTAEQLISAAMFGNPPTQIAEELRDLLEAVNFRRHLEVRGLTLSESEFQMSLTGDGVGLGIALTDLFVQRVRDVEKLVKRTAERVLQKPYRDRGRISSSIQEDFSLFVSVPRAGSFAVTFQVGSNRQMSLPGEDMGGRVVDEVVDCLEVLQSKGENDLMAKIPDESYRRNFVALARNIAPDGKSIRSVGFTANTRGHEKKFTFAKPREEIISTVEVTKITQQTKSAELVTVSGFLKYADARNEARGIIDIIDDKDKQHKVLVPSGMMSDIVRPMFGEQVIVKGYLNNKEITLEDISQVPKDSDSDKQ